MATDEKKTEQLKLPLSPQVNEVRWEKPVKVPYQGRERIHLKMRRPSKK